MRKTILAAAILFAVPVFAQNHPIRVYSDSRVGAIFFGLGIIGLFPNFGFFAKQRNRAIDEIAEGRKKK